MTTVSIGLARRRSQLALAIPWATLLVAGPGGCGQLFCGPGTEAVEDAHSCGGGEVVLRFENRPIWCPHDTALFTAIVTVDPDGVYTFCGTRLDELYDWCPNCLREPDEFQSCLVEVPLLRRVLTEQQADELAELLDNVPERICLDNGPHVEPCFLPTYEFHGRHETTVCTSGDMAGEFPEAMGAVGGLLHDLAYDD